MIKISIIIPVYNCEQSIEQSIRSIQEQTIKEVEIICVDDGSTDNSAKIIQKLQKEDKRIVLYSQENQGSGAARNNGIGHAQGEFIAFLDADDYYLDTDALESMFLVCKEQGVSVCGTNIRIERGEKLVPDQGCYEIIEASKKNKVLNYQEFQFDYGYCGFIFEKALIVRSKVQFPLYRRFQDPVFFVRVMNVAEKFCFIDKALYVYRAPNVLQRFNAKNTIDLLWGLLDNLQFALEHDLNKLLVRTLERVEKEYAGVICRNLSVEGISLLLEINQIAKVNMPCMDHTIAPLEKILKSVRREYELQKQTVQDKLLKCKRIYPYGAGQACIDFLKYLKECNLLNKVESILVTNLYDNPAVMKDIQLVEIGDYQVQEGDLVIITVAEIHQHEVIVLLEEKGIINYEVVNNCMDFGK